MHGFREWLALATIGSVLGCGGGADPSAGGSGGASATTGASGGHGGEGGNGTGAGKAGGGGDAGGAGDACSGQVIVAYPSNGGIVDVRAKYGAKGDGKTDDTSAIQKAIAENVGKMSGNIIYFPRGTYLVSDTLAFKNGSTWGANLVFQGECRGGSILRLADGANGFGDAGKPNAVVFTASPTPKNVGNFNPKIGEGNDAFRNSIRDLTIDVGEKNAGAIGVDFLGSNVCEIRRVTVRSTDVGVAGIAMIRKSSGPCLISEVEVDGFDFGIEATTHDYSTVLEHVVLNGQKTAAIDVEAHVLSIRDLTTNGSAPAITSGNASSFVTLVDADLTESGGKGTAIAFSAAAGLFARNVKTHGYAKALMHPSGGPGGTTIDETALPAKYAVPTTAGSLDLAVKETPALPTFDSSTWHSITEFGATPNDSSKDLGSAINAAVAAGVRFLYLPTGVYTMKDTAKLGGTLEALVGFEGWVNVKFATAKPAFEVSEDANKPLFVAGFYGYANSSGAPPLPTVTWIEHSSSRSLVLQDLQLTGTVVNGYVSSAGAGDLYLDDMAALSSDSTTGTWMLGASQKIWGRHFNVELKTTKIDNAAATLWILGIKAEQPGTAIVTHGTGRTELLGGLLYPVTTAGDPPAFEGEDGARESLAFATTAYGAGTNYATLVSESAGARKLLASDAVKRGQFGSIVPLFVGGSASP